MFEPGVTEEGENEQEARAGRLEQASATELANAPNCGWTLIVYVADCPAVTLALAGETLTPKLVTVIVTAADGDIVTPLLVAVRFTAFMPNGQAIVVPDPVPQAPVQLKVKGH